MDLLITEADVRARMALPDQTNATAFIQSAIRASQLWVEQKFGSPISKVVGKVDKFCLDPTMHNGVQPGGFFRCKLRQGLLLSTPVVQIGDAWNSASGDQTTLVLNTDFRMTDEYAEQGVVEISNQVLAGLSAFNPWPTPGAWTRAATKFATVTYDAGFEAGDDGIPDWLTEAILAYVPVVFNMGPQTQRDPEAAAGYQASGDHAEAVLALHLRTRSLVLRPV